MFTYKFVGLDAADAETPYYYGSTPAKPEIGHILVYDKTGNRYAIVRIEGEGLVDDGDGFDSQKKLAWAEIGGGEKVPTLWLRKVGREEFGAKEIKVTGRSFDYEEVKEQSRRNREIRLGSKPLPTGECEICKKPTNQSFGFGNAIHYHCDDHRDLLFERVTGKRPKPTAG